MDNKLVVQNAIDFIAAIYGIEKQASADGKINMADLGLLFSLAPLFTSANSQGVFKNLPKAMGALNQQDIADVLSYAAGKFMVKDVRTQKIVSESISLLLNAYHLAQALGEK